MARFRGFSGARAHLMDIWTLPLITYYAAIIAVFCLYGLHRIQQVLGHRRGLRPGPPPARFEDLPRVTIQLPMFNERAMAERVIEAACGIEYPKDRLEIQVLDDSTDEAAEVAARCCRRLAAGGHPITYHHRDDRTGYKAGALAAGLAQSSGEIVALFDADFVPPADFLERTIHEFTDEQVGMVQARWTHLNRDESWLTHIQTLSLDGHFVVEQAARAARGTCFNFNGTAGLWRRTAIDDAGGWEHDTLTEDTDLSYRAQLRGWTFRYRPDVTCPAELPISIPALASQQHRWSKGLIQNAIKLLPRVMASPTPWRSKVEAILHLTSPLPYAAIVMLTLLVPAALLLASPGAHDPPLTLALGILCLLMGTGAAALFALAGQASLGRPWWRAAIWLPVWMAIGIGMSVVTTRAILEALLGLDTAFVRTPKAGDREDPYAAATAAWRRAWPAGLLEIMLGLVMLGSLLLAPSVTLALVGGPFLVLFATGYFAVGVPRLAGYVRSLRSTRADWRALVAANSPK